MHQQAQVIKDTTCLDVGSYTGDMGVDFWNKEKWHEQFDKYDVLVMTCQILVNILGHGFIGLQNINLLILDECHNASKKHPYAQLLGFHDNYPKDDQPHILGLTASIINQKYKKKTTINIRSFLVKKMKDLEALMRSKCVTCSEQQNAELYATKPIEIIKSYSMEIATNGFDEVHEMGNPEGTLIKKLYAASIRYSE